MTVQLNHTIVPSLDAEASAAFVAELLGLPAPRRFGPFVVVETDNGVSLDYVDVGPGDEKPSRHYAFLVSEDDFDAIFGRIRERGIDFYADPGGTRRGEINHRDGGRGCYFADPDGHWLEILTHPYGSSSS